MKKVPCLFIKLFLLGLCLHLVNSCWPINQIPDGTEICTGSLRSISGSSLNQLTTGSTFYISAYVNIVSFCETQQTIFSISIGENEYIIAYLSSTNTIQATYSGTTKTISYPVTLGTWNFFYATWTSISASFGIFPFGSSTTTITNMQMNSATLSTSISSLSSLTIYLGGTSANQNRINAEFSDIIVHTNINLLRPYYFNHGIGNPVTNLFLTDFHEYYGWMFTDLSGNNVKYYGGFNSQDYYFDQASYPKYQIANGAVEALMSSVTGFYIAQNFDIVQDPTTTYWKNVLAISFYVNKISGTTNRYLYTRVTSSNSIVYAILVTSNNKWAFQIGNTITATNIGVTGYQFVSYGIHITNNYATISVFAQSTTTSYNTITMALTTAESSTDKTYIGNTANSFGSSINFFRIDRGTGGEYLINTCAGSTLTIGFFTNTLNILNSAVPATCPTGKYKSSSANMCRQCISTCSACSAPLTCTNCNSPFTLSGSTCTCPTPATFKSNLGICDICLSYSSYMPLTCSSCYGGITPGASGCCNTGYYYSSGSCLQCLAKCQTCTTGTTCVACTNNFSWDNTAIDCVCPDGKFVNNINNGACESCDPNCLKCSGTSTTCTDCGLHYILNVDTCDCPSKYFVDANSNCNPCSTGCLTCTSSTVCTLCDTNYNPVNNACVCPTDHYIDSSNNCLPCTSPCSACQGSDTYCTACVQYYTLDSSTNTCNCDPPSYFDSNGDCSLCALNCRSCTGISTDCTECKDTYYTSTPTGVDSIVTCTCDSPNGIKDQTTMSCAPCGTGYYLSGTDCLPCDLSCVTCDSSTNCLTCANNYDGPSSGVCTCNNPYHISNVATGACELCVAGTYLTGTGTCDPCDSKCLTCSGTSDQCLTCATNYVTDATVYCKCPNQYYVAADGTCQQCDPKCATCQTSATNCQTCATNYQFDANNICICPPNGFYINPTTHACLACDAKCSQCTAQSTCTACATGYTSSGGDCVCLAPYYFNAGGVCVLCPDGSYVNPSGACVVCDNSCAKCSGSATSCTQCATNYVQTLATFPSTCTCTAIGQYIDPSDGTCHSCASGTYVDATLNCAPCARNCATCTTSATNCLTCASDYSNPAPACACPAGKYIDNTNACVTCDASCAQCSTSATSCSSCAQNYVSSGTGNTCICTGSNYLNANFCPSGSYVDAGGSCVPCPKKCGTCQTTSGTCITCGTDFVSSGGDCVCPDGYFIDPTGACLVCSPSCTLCTGTATNCQDCPTNYKATATGCVCPSGYFTDNANNCNKCDPSCSTCSGPATYCTTCAPYYQQTSPGTCVCPTGGNYYLDAQFNCGQCLTPCSTCQGSATFCKSCPNNYVIVDGGCVCPSGYAILNGGKTWKLGVCTKCDPQCAKCSGLTSRCLLCATNYVAIVNTCVCPDGYFVDSNGNCLKCSAQCAKCQTTSTQCTVCSTNYVTSGNTCICPNGYYVDVLGNCLPCSVQCATCTQSPSNCVTCKTNYALSGNTCSCPTGYYLDFTMNCLQCDPSCSACYSSPTNCQSCPNNYVASGSGCICPNGRYVDPTTSTHQSSRNCLACAVQCATCSGSASSCVTCATNYQFVNNVCTCGSGFILDASGNCLACSPQCGTCSGTQSNCLTCGTNFVLQSSICTCPTSQGYFLDSSGFCQKCGSQCVLCSTTMSNCQSCSPNYVASGSTCVCPSSYYVDGLGQCQQCTGLCSTCAGASTYCTSCPTNYVPIDGVCQCPNGYYLNGVNCLQCAQNCATCSGSASNCLTCATNYVPVNQVCTCPAGYYVNGAGACIKCANQCGTCSTSPTNCLTCATNYVTSGSTCSCPTGYFVNSTGSCNPCTIPCATCNQVATTCLTCVDSTMTLSSGTCRCQSGKFLQGTTCVNCDSRCQVCTNATSCTTCKFNYQLSNGICTCPTGMDTGSGCVPCQAPCNTCSVAPNQCDTCFSNYTQNGSICTCPSGYYINPSNQSCLKCAKGCLTCSTTATNCQTCDVGYNLVGTQCLCGSGYYVSGQDCLPCSSPCANCTNSATKCLTCISNYQYNSNRCFCTSGKYDNKTGCAPCSKNCLTCMNSATTCLSCASYLQLVSAQCVCESGKYDTGAVCLACNNPCATCSITPNNCTSCLNGYILTNNTCVCPAGKYSTGTKCNPCKHPCATCVNDSSYCLSCVDGYSLNSDATCSLILTSTYTVSVGLQSTVSAVSLVYGAISFNSPLGFLSLCTLQNFDMLRFSQVTYPDIAEQMFGNSVVGSNTADPQLNVDNSQTTGKSSRLLRILGNTTSSQATNMPPKFAKYNISPDFLVTFSFNLIILGAITAVGLIAYVIHYFKKIRMMELINKAFLWNLFFSYLSLCYIRLVISIILQFMINDPANQSRISLFCAIFCSLGLLLPIFGIFVARSYLRYDENTKLPNWLQRCMVFVGGVKSTRIIEVLAIPLNLFRMLIVGMIAVFASAVPLLQISIYTVFSLGIIYYTLKVKPFIRFGLVLKTFISESFLLIAFAGVFIAIFSSQDDDPKPIVGWLMIVGQIGIIATAIFFLPYELYIWKKTYNDFAMRVHPVSVFKVLDQVPKDNEDMDVKPKTIDYSSNKPNKEALLMSDSKINLSHQDIDHQHAGKTERLESEDVTEFDITSKHNQRTEDQIKESREEVLRWRIEQN